MDMLGSSPRDAAPVGRIDTGPSPYNSGDETVEEWGAQASASTLHPTAKGQPWPLGVDIQPISPLLVAILPAALVLLRCYRQIIVVKSVGTERLRSLAEEEGAGGETSCWQVDVEAASHLEMPVVALNLRCRCGLKVCWRD